jgi:hypothetical protein
MGALAKLSSLERDYERSGMEFDRIVFFLKSPEASKDP